MVCVIFTLNFFFSFFGAGGGEGGNRLRRTPWSLSRGRRDNFGFWGAFGGLEMEGTFMLRNDLRNEKMMKLTLLCICFLERHWLLNLSNRKLLPLVREARRSNAHNHSTSPRSGTITRRRFGMGTGESTCPCGSDSFSVTQHLLSSQAFKARLLNVVVCIV